MRKPLRHRRRGDARQRHWPWLRTTALVDLGWQGIDPFNDRNALRYIALEMRSSVSPTHGDQGNAEQALA
jgi:hypothetical protein